MSTFLEYKPLASHDFKLSNVPFFHFPCTLGLGFWSQIGLMLGYGLWLDIGLTVKRFRINSFFKEFERTGNSAHK